MSTVPLIWAADNRIEQGVLYTYAGATVLIRFKGYKQKCNSSNKPTRVIYRDSAKRRFIAILRGQGLT